MRLAPTFLGRSCFSLEARSAPRRADVRVRRVDLRLAMSARLYAQDFEIAVGRLKTVDAEGCG